MPTLQRCLIASLLLLLIQPSLGDERVPDRNGGHPGASADEHPTGAELVDRVRMALEPLESLHMTVHAHSEYQPGPITDGDPKQCDLRIQIWMARDNRFRLEADRDATLFATVVSDGTKITEWDHSTNRWTQYVPSKEGYFGSPLLISDDDLVASLLNPFMQSWVGPDSPYINTLRSLLDHVDVHSIDRDTIEGRDCYVLRASLKDTESKGGIKFASEGMLAFDTAMTLPVCEQSTVSAVALRFMPVFDSTQRLAYECIEQNPELPADVFRFDPPKNSAFIALGGLMPSENTPLIGKPMPTTRFYTPDGQPADLARYYEDKPILLVFWATWCAPCKGELADLKGLAADEDLGSKVNIVAISTDKSADTLRAFLDKHPLPFITLHDKDDQAAKALGIDGVPCTLIIDRTGTVRGQWSGWTPLGLRLRAIRDRLTALNDS